MIPTFRWIGFSLSLWVLPVVYALDNSTGVEVTQILKTTSSWNGNPLVYPEGQAEITGLLVEILPGAETGWHEHSVPSFGIVLEGTLEVTLKSGEVKRLQSGDALAEVVDTLHNGRNISNQRVKIIVFYTGAVGKSLTRKDP